MSDEQRCEHKHTHPPRCDDCGAPWCHVCATYHEPRREGTHECARRLRAEVEHLRAALDAERLRRGRETARIGVFMQAMSWLARNGQKTRANAWVDAADAAAKNVQPEDFVRIAEPIRRGKEKQ